MAYRFTDPSGFTYESGKLFLGLDPATGREVGTRLERHALTIGGSRTGKGAALLVPNARRWPHNLLCIDTKGENAALSWQAREAMGQQVCILDPLDTLAWQNEQSPQGAPRRLRATFNPLASVDPTSRRARAKLSAIGNGLVVVHDPKHMEWVQGARSILAGVCAYVVADAPPEERSFAVVRAILMQKSQIVNEDGELVGGLYHTAQLMADDDRCGGLIREAGVTIMTALESEKGLEKDFLGGARRATSWLDDEGIAETLGSSSFDLDDLKNGAVSVFLVLPADPDTMATYAPFLRLFVKAALNSMSDGGSGSGQGKHCLFMLDEFYSLGKMPELVEAAGRMPSYGVHLWPFLQDLGQLQELYGPRGSETFFGSADAATFLGNSDLLTLEYISRRVGKLTPDEVAAPPPQDSAPVDVAHARAIPRESPDDWLPMAGYIAADNENERRRVEQVNETRRRAVDLQNAKRRAEYDHAMKRVGSPRFTPEEIAALVGKGEKDDLARSVIVFATGGIVLNLLLAPYFLHDRHAPHNAEANQTIAHLLPRLPFGGLAKSFWLTGGDWAKKLALGAVAFIFTLGVLEQFAPPPLVFWLVMMTATVYAPPFLTSRFGVNWVYAALFAFGFMSAMGNAEPARAFADYPPAIAFLIGGIFSGGLMLIFGKLVYWFWRGFRL